MLLNNSTTNSNLHDEFVFQGHDRNVNYIINKNVPLTLRSAYFQQIEEDVEKHAKSIAELKSSISTFQTKDMAELFKFQKHVESILEKLTDESQVNKILS